MSDEHRSKYNFVAQYKVIMFVLYGFYAYDFEFLVANCSVVGCPTPQSKGTTSKIIELDMDNDCVKHKQRTIN